MSEGAHASALSGFIGVCQVIFLNETQGRQKFFQQFA
jgi:hypothetical protein